MMTDENRLTISNIDLANLGKNSAIIIRGKSQKQRLQLINHFYSIRLKKEFKLLVSDDIELARDTDGLHIPERKVGAAKINLHKWRHKLGIVTASAHSATAIQKAQLLGVDAVLLSPIFETISHPGANNIGLLRLARLCHTYKIPIIALGGIKLEHIRAMRNAKAAGIAGIKIFDCDQS